MTAMYSRTLVARTLTARLPRLIRTRSCPNEILPKAQKNICSYLIMNVYVVCTHKNRYIKAILMSTHNIQLLCYFP